MDSRTKVLIIGAGASGIAAASWLAERGFTDFLILEAEDRIGGRIYTTTFGGSTIDRGCQWVHGEQGNIVFELANPLNLLEGSPVNVKECGRLSDGSGENLDTDVAIRFFCMLKNIGEECEEAMKVFKGNIQEFYLQEYKKRLKEDGIDFDSSPLAEAIFHFFRRSEESVDGCDSWLEESCQGSTEYWICEGNLLLNWKRGGYHSIIDILTKRYPDRSKELPVRSKVQLNKEVTSVQWDGEDRVVTTCADGSRYLSDHVLVTVSLGVLKSKCNTLFQPPLPAYKLTAIQGLGIGTVDKIFLLFPHQWWDDNEFFSILWTSEAIKNFRLEEGDGSRRWLQDVFCFHPVANVPNTLIGWVVGRSARYMETLPLSAVMDGCMELLQFFFGQLYNIPCAQQVDRSTWGTNDHFRGSYSFRSVDSVAMGATPALLAHPLVNSQGKPVVMFAGEATHEHYFSTVHGAVETGFREAERLAALCGVGSSWPRKCCVVIVGAGIAGLAAAKTLLEGGVTDFVVLEAQDQAGGRIRSVPVNGSWVEAGAQWVHGQNHAVWQLAYDKGLLSDCTSAEGEGPYLRESGCEVPLSLVQEVGGVVGDIMEQCSQFAVCEQTEAVPRSVGAYLHSQFQQYVQHCSCDDEGKKLRWELYDWHLRFYVIDNSCTKLDNLSARSYGTYLFSGGNDYMNFKNGYSSLIQALVEDLPAGKLHFNSPVSTVQWDAGVHVKNGLYRWGNSSNPVLVLCSNGLCFEAEHVIVTCSLGYLKEHHARMFQPGLPHSITQTIEDMGFATINKIFLIYNEPWWQPDIRGFQIIWPLKGSDFLARNESSGWLRDLSGFDVLPDKPAVLLGWVGGQGAEAVEELNEEQVANHCTQLLRHFTGRQSIPLPHKTIRSQWHKNEYIRGGYSNNGHLCDKSCSKPSDLSQPVYTYVGQRERPTLLLAGEATHPHYYSTTHGAYESGHKQASCILTYRNNIAPS